MKFSTELMDMGRSVRQELREHRAALQASWVLKRMQKQADRSDMIRIDGSIDDFDLRYVRDPRSHKNGFIQEAQFDDVLWLRTTTPNALSDSLHDLFLYGDDRPHEYRLKSINEDCQVIGHSARATSAREMVAIPRFEPALAQMRTLLDVERISEWPHAMTTDQFVRKPTND